MDGNTFRMSFGKRLIKIIIKKKKSLFKHSNIAIPLLFDLNGSGLLNSISNESNEKEHSPKFIRKQNWPSRWRASLFRKRLDRNLFNVGFGK
ncbi:Neuropeptide-like protein-1 [Meloidogyne graminicola]|uniref:Neuropeptide-like protein-1 n=1 Tax=Meloidogyne graminicola TaxID=189291 RepID=A0A8S9ZFX3_9BILA|nr:Neuropeptide-like protein-1 [Meloidogyne graminicola]